MYVAARRELPSAASCDMITRPPSLPLSMSVFHFLASQTRSARALLV